MFEVVVTNRESVCKNCRKPIPAGTPKLRFYKPLGMATVSGSLCFPCLRKMLEDNGHALVKTTANYTVTERGERILWVLLEDDAQIMAERMIGRRLTEDELYQVKKGVEWGLSDYGITLETAIELAIEEGEEGEV